MGTSCLIRCGVVLLLADDQRSSFMTNGHLSYMGGSSILRPRLATLAVSRYSGRYVYHTWRSTSYGGLVCPLSEVHYARCVSIVWEPRFPYLALIPASILRGGGQWQDQVRITALTVLVALLIRRCRQATLGIGYLIPKIRGQHRPCCWMQLTHRFHPLPLWLIRPPKHLYMIPPPPLELFIILLIIFYAVILLLLLLLLERSPVTAALILIFVLLIHRFQFRSCRRLQLCQK